MTYEITDEDIDSDSGTLTVIFRKYIEQFKF